MTNRIILFLFLVLAAPPAVAQVVSIGTFGGAVASTAQDQSHGWLYGFEAKVELVSHVYFRPSAAFGKLGDVSFDFGSREGSRLRIYRFDVIIGQLPEKKNTFGGGMIFGLGYVYLSRKYDRDQRDRIAAWGGNINYKIFNHLSLELSGCLYSRGFGQITGDARIGIDYLVDLERLFYGK